MGDECTFKKRLRSAEFTCIGERTAGSGIPGYIVAEWRRERGGLSVMATEFQRDQPLNHHVGLALLVGCKAIQVRQRLGPVLSLERQLREFEIRVAIGRD